jgi:hypothetical protein
MEKQTSKMVLQPSPAWTVDTIVISSREICLRKVYGRIYSYGSGVLLCATVAGRLQQELSRLSWECTTGSGSRIASADTSRHFVSWSIVSVESYVLAHTVSNYAERKARNALRRH